MPSETPRFKGGPRRGVSNGWSGWDRSRPGGRTGERRSSSSKPGCTEVQPTPSGGASVATLGSASVPSEGGSESTVEDDGDAYSRLQSSRRSRTARSGPGGFLAASHVFRCVRRTDERRWTSRWIASAQRKTPRWFGEAFTPSSPMKIRSARRSSRLIRRAKAPTSGGSTVIDGRRIRVGAASVRQDEGTKRFPLSSWRVNQSKHVEKRLLTFFRLSWIHSRRWAQVSTFSRVGEVRG